MSLHLLAIAALFVGPAVGGVVLRSRRLVWGLAAFVTVVVFGLVIGHIVPDVVAAGGPWTVAALLGGIALASLHHRVHPAHGNRRDAEDGQLHEPHDDHESGAAVVVALAALLLHMLLEGVAMAVEPRGTDTAVLVAAVAIHRIPIGLAIWWVTCRRAGRTGALALLGLGGVVTHVGYVAAAALSSPDSMALFAWLQAVTAGSLLHVAGAHLPVEAQCGARNRAGAVGVALGAAWVLAAALVTHERPAGLALHGAAVVAGAVAFVAAHRHGTSAHGVAR